MENFNRLRKELIDLEDDLTNLELSTFESNEKKELQDLIKEHIFNKSIEVYNASSEESAIWDYCSFNIYERNYQETLNSFINDNNKEHINEKIFIESEIYKYSKLLENFDKKNYFPGLKLPLEKKIAFLREKQKPLISIELTDYSDTNAKEKIIFLKELGILNFLWEKHPNLSNYKIAQVLSAITGINPTTIQSYTNPIYSGPAVAQDKNPMEDKKLVAIVKKKLLDLKILDN